MLEFFLSKSVFGYYKTKKKEEKKCMANKFEREGGGKALVAGTLKKYRFLRLPLEPSIF